MMLHGVNMYYIPTVIKLEGINKNGKNGYPRRKPRQLWA